MSAPVNSDEPQKKGRGRPRKPPVIAQDGSQQPGGNPGDPKVIGKTVRLLPEDWAVIDKISKVSSLEPSTVARLMIQQGIRKIREEVAAGNPWYKALMPDNPVDLDLT